MLELTEKRLAGAAVNLEYRLVHREHVYHRCSPVPIGSQALNISSEYFSGF